MATKKKKSTKPASPSLAVLKKKAKKLKGFKPSMGKQALIALIEKHKKSKDTLPSPIDKNELTPETNANAKPASEETNTSSGSVEKNENGASADPKNSGVGLNVNQIFNYAAQIREQIRTATDVGPEELSAQIYGAGGVLGVLRGYRAAMPLDVIKQYDELLALVEKEAEAKIGIKPTSTNGNKAAPTTPVTSQSTPAILPAATPPIVIAKNPEEKMNPEEKLTYRFDKLLKFLENFKKERVCHAQHVSDFCKQNSADGLEFTYDVIGEKLKGTVGDIVQEHPFVVTK